MNQSRLSPHGQNGAALLTVLLLVATLSFIVISISERTIIAARRTVNVNAQSELLWRAFGAEALAASALKTALAASDGKIALDNPFLAAPIDIPMEGGAGKIRFADMTACFNLNGLVTDLGGGQFEENKAAAAEFIALVDGIGLGSGEAARLAAVITDWIDSDSLQGIRGAEDGFYTGLPTPFRTGGTLLADESELRAMGGVNAEIFKQIRPFVCAQPEAALIAINVNRLDSRHGPLIVGLLNGKINIREAQDIIAKRPPGGFSEISEFWALVDIPEFTPPPELQERTALTSAYYEARVELNYDSSAMEMVMVFANTDGDIKRVSRRIGPAL